MSDEEKATVLDEWRQLYYDQCVLTETQAHQHLEDLVWKQRAEQAEAELEEMRIHRDKAVLTRAALNAKFERRRPRAENQRMIDAWDEDKKLTVVAISHPDDLEVLRGRAATTQSRMLDAISRTQFYPASEVIHGEKVEAVKKLAQEWEEESLAGVSSGAWRASHKIHARQLREVLSDSD